MAINLFNRNASSTPSAVLSSSNKGAATKKLFNPQQEKKELPVSTIIQKSISSIGRNKEGILCFEFACTGGKGSSPQAVPVAELDEFILALQELIDNGIPDRSNDDSVSGTMNRSVKVEYMQEGEKEVPYLSFRTSGGRGAKPSYIAAENLQKMVDFLAENADGIFSFFEQENEVDLMQYHSSNLPESEEESEESEEESEE